jgi:DNA polymerase-2
MRGGKTFALVEDRFRPFFYLRVSDREKLKSIAFRVKPEIRPTSMRTMDGETCLELAFNTEKTLKETSALLERKGIRSYEADVSVIDKFLMNSHIHGALSIEGPRRKGETVDWIYQNPHILPSSRQPELSILSIDIETNPYTDSILAIGMAGTSPGRPPFQNILYLHSPQHPDGWQETEMVRCMSEEELLNRFAEYLRTTDPDIITGWNVIDFDFKIIAERFSRYSIPFLIGRSHEEARILPPGKGKLFTMIVPGRYIADGLRLIRASPYRFEDNSLQTVAETVLNRGKTITEKSGEEKIEEILYLYENEPREFCRYCLNDAALVLDILDHTGLIELTVKRTLLIGIRLAKAWTSIASFEYMYIEELHKRAIAAPTKGVDALPLGDAPGGAILKPEAGIWDNVMVFDFKSLYPSIILTFNIDPLTLCGEQKDAIQAPNGGCFSREAAILPGLIDRFFKNREEAKRNGDETGSYVFKIIMNSLYGCLGASGCRFAGSMLAGAVTSFGQMILHWCEAYLQEQGFTVLYGDTDSIFILSGLAAECDTKDIHEKANAICSRVNSALRTFIEDSYRTDCRLELEYEKTYLRFFLPAVRSSTSGGLHEGIPVGRAKGYAGLIAAEHAQGKNSEADIEIKGMEAVRRDWTDLAHEFQITLLTLLFFRKPETEIIDYIGGTVRKLKKGELDEKLVYIKQLKKAVGEYVKNKPPHVKAAMQLDPKEQNGLIRYIITEKGPQPVSRRNAAADYRHYIEKQLKPIAGTFSAAFNKDLLKLLDSEQQLELF